MNSLTKTTLVILQASEDTENVFSKTLRIILRRPTKYAGPPKFPESKINSTFEDYNGNESCKRLRCGIMQEIKFSPIPLN